MADIVLISPRFEMSYWGLEHALPLMGRRANMPPAALPLIAALTPPGHGVTIMDENVAPIDFDRCARADIVGLTGMIVQRHRMREILEELKRRGIFVAVGGFLAEGFEYGFLFVVVFGALLVVFFLFEDAEAFALEGLGSLAVGAALDAVFWGGVG